MAKKDEELGRKLDEGFTIIGNKHIVKQQFKTVNEKCGGNSTRQGVNRVQSEI